MLILSAVTTMFLSKKNHIGESALEEIFNATTHGIGVLLGITALTLLVVLSSIDGSLMKIVTCAIYGSAMIFMFSASTFYHALQEIRIKNIFKIIDHISIYFLIAATYTPVMLVKLGGAWGWGMFGVIWGLAAFGTVFKLSFTGRFEAFSLSLYGVMGWLVLIALHPLIHALPMGGILWLVAGGLCYSLGIIFYVLDSRYQFAHFLWHLLVLAGCACHFFAILLYVVR
jgi:hemolysin III